LEDLTKPTPPGEEPKSIQLIKAITWFGVIALVLVEIFVSIKSGGSPSSTNQNIISPAPPSLQELSYPSTN
jgi:hypothetical protein